jgi:hypothetical protein
MGKMQIRPAKYVEVVYVKDYDFSTRFSYLVEVEDFEKQSVEEALIKFSIDAGALCDQKGYKMNLIEVKKMELTEKELIARGLRSPGGSGYEN